MSEPIDLEKKRAEKIQREGMALHAEGKAFRFTPWHFADGEAEVPSTGLSDPVACACGKPLEVILMIEELNGIVMSRDDARALAEDLLAHAEEDHGGPPETTGD